MTAAQRAGGVALPAVAGVALCAALLAAAPGCERKGASTSSDAAAASVAPAPSPATDPALNWGGTTPHDQPPVADPLIAQAEAAMRKADPKFDKFEVDYFSGDLDRDGRDDVAIEYGIGEEGAMRHVAKSVRVLLARNDGLQLQADQTDKFEDCPAVRGIRDGRLWADGLEACMLPFPRTLNYYQFEWRDGGLVRVATEDAQQRVLSRLRAMREAIEAGKVSTLDANLRPGPTIKGETAPAPDPVFADAKRRRAFADAIGLLSHLELQRLDDHERSASFVKPRGPDAGERRLHIDTAPDDATVEIDGYTYVVDARATVEWPEGDGVGYHLRWRLIDGELYLEEADAHDLDGLES
ncbi:hypothetical protein ACI2IY_15525 [Lysobacter enzymogenes]|uniref:hypothetical protein n=1 Tax=Lysobacter enzymogenes TaxID=69 RepID=UPI00384B0F62